MQLKFNSKHKSIEEFPDKEIDDFAIFTGINGSGKTQLLEAIRDGKVEVAGIKTEEIQYFDSKKFQIPGEQKISTESVKRDKINLWKNFIDSDPRRGSLKTRFEQFKSSFTSQQIETIKKISNEKNKSVLLLELENLDNDDDTPQKLTKYKQNIKNLKAEKRYEFRIFELAFNYNGFIDDITQEEFMEKINVYTSEHYFFAQQISNIFVNFNHLCSVEYAKLLKEYENTEIIPITYREKATKNILQKYGGKYPWKFIDDLFESFDDFKYKITKPTEFELKDLDDTQSKEFIAELYNEKTNQPVSFDDLSSGEKTLLTITLMTFNTILTKHLPKLVLLDEIDSTLHPSMTKDLLLSLRNIFVNNGIKVILVTHSPSTIAFAQKNSIYLIDNTSKELIKDSENQAALQILTQGYMILKDSHVIFDAINNYDLTIFSEGNNVDYIQTAINLHQKDKSDKVNVWKGIEGKSGFGQLEMLYYLFNSVNLAKKILIVFDPDVSLKVQTNEKKLIFVTKLESVENNYAVSGIESVLPDSAFVGFRTNTQDEFTGDVTKRFPDKYKKPLCEKLTSEKNPDVFKNFKSLTDNIVKILDNYDQ